MKLKALLFAITALAFTQITIGQEKENVRPVKWYSFEEAIDLHLKDPKPLFVDIFTEWCVWCKKMDNSTFNHPVIAEYMNQNFYPVKFDAEQNDTIFLQGHAFINPNPENDRSAHQLAQALLKGKMSYPAYVFMSDKLELITVVNGFMPAEKFEPILNYFGEKEYEKQPFEEFSKVFNGKVSAEAQ